GCPFKVWTSSLSGQALWLPISHKNNSPPSLPPPPLTNCVPSGLQSTLITLPLCPCSFPIIVPSEASHRQMLPSSPQPAKRVPSGLQARRRILWCCPTQQRVRVTIFHTCTPRTKLPQAKRCPSGLHATP